MKIGFIGLGKMGKRMVFRLLSQGYDVVVWNRSVDPVQQLQSELSDEQKKHFSSVASITDFQQLPSTRILWSMLPAGDATEQALTQISSFMQKGDIVIDGGNAHFKDTQKRFETFQKDGVRFLGVGVSGGVHAEKNGYAMMIGGDKSAYDELKELFTALAAPSANFDYFGTGGAGHFVKMVHNAIEYGMMQAIGEGFGILEKSPYELDLVTVAKEWQKGTIVSSFLIDRAYDALVKDADLSDITGVIDATGEAAWALEEAKQEKVAVPVIEESLAYRTASKTNMTVQSSFAARMVAALRHEFGGHAVKKSV